MHHQMWLLPRVLHFAYVQGFSHVLNIGRVIRIIYESRYVPEFRIDVFNVLDFIHYRIRAWHRVHHSLLLENDKSW